MSISKKTDNNPLLTAAIDYAQRGLPVFPLQGKRPLISKQNGGSGVLDGTCDQKQIHDWWGDHPAANIGLPCGENSGFWVLDVDPDKGGDVSLNELFAKHGKLPDTVMQKTGGGGVHYLFKYNGEAIRNRANDIGMGLDTRSTKGYIVAPPSAHPDTGKKYEWVQGQAPWEIEPAEAPDWLIGLVTSSKKERERKADDTPSLALAAKPTLVLIMPMLMVVPPSKMNAWPLKKPLMVSRKTL